MTKKDFKAIAGILAKNQEAIKKCYEVEAGRIILENNKRVFGLDNYDRPTRADAAAHFLADMLNSGVFEAYYEHYMRQ
jgi:hypothetical protein